MNFTFSTQQFSILVSYRHISVQKILRCDIQDLNSRPEPETEGFYWFHCIWAPWTENVQQRDEERKSHLKFFLPQMSSHTDVGKQSNIMILYHQTPGQSDMVSLVFLSFVPW